MYVPKINQIEDQAVLLAYMRAYSFAALATAGPGGLMATHLPFVIEEEGGRITLLAHMAQVPIQTVFIETPSPYLGKGWPIWRPPEFPVVFRVRLGRRFAPEADHHGMLRRLETYFATELKKKQKSA